MQKHLFTAHLVCRDWAAAYQNTVEHPKGYWLEAVGTIPAGLKGTYFR